MKIKKEDYEMVKIGNEFQIKSKITNKILIDYEFYKTKKEAKTRLEEIVNNTNLYWS